MKRRKLWSQVMIRHSITFYCLESSQFSEDCEDSFIKLCECHIDDVSVEEAVLEYATLKNVYAPIRQLLPEDLKLGEVLPFLIDKQMAPGCLICQFCTR